MTETTSLITASLTALAALLVVLAALLLAARAARAAGMRPGRRLAVEETVALDSRRRLTLLRCDGRHLLLLTGGAQEVVVGWLPVEPVPPGGSPR
jgi:flagellar protein FliO/FliZ